MNRRPPALLASLFLAGCATHPLTVSQAEHISNPPTRPADLPAPVEHPVFLPKPTAQAKTDTYSVVVNNVPVRDLMFALARDAKLNVDVHPLVKGSVTINALNQTLPQILDRVANQISMRYTLENGVLSIVPDRPYLKTYVVDYVNVARSVKGSVSVATSVATSGSGGNGSGGGNNSETAITNTTENKFWDRLEKNLQEIIASTRRVSLQDKKDRIAQETKDEQARNGEVAEQKQEAERRKQEEKMKAAQTVASAGAGAPALFAMLEGKDKQGDQQDEPQGNDVFINPETGTVTINATNREHAKIQEYLDRVAAGARRQVLIEATIVEVALSNEYQAGIDWKIFRNNAAGAPQDNRLNITQSSLGDALGKLPYTVLSYTKTAAGLLNGADITATMKALEQFGKTKVLSSPKIMALNNQTAVLKVVDEKVYFTLKLDIQAATTTSPETRTWTSELHTLPVGMVMSVTPQVGENDTVSLNVRPTISRITGYKQDPAVAIVQANSSASAQTVQSLVPEIQVREVESTLRLASNETAVLGGLIQDQIQNQRDGLPLASRLPWGIGDLFSTRDDVTQKTELVIFLRPVVVRDPSLNGELRDYRQYLPQDDFFRSKQDEISAFPTGLTAH
jgi:general secretion pathway protein D